MPTGKFKNYDHCRISGSSDLRNFLNFETALAGGFLDDTSDFLSESIYPLTLSFCPQSGLVQVNEVVDRDALFKKYYYKTGVVKTLVNHFEDMADEYVKTGASSVLEIGCNDFSMLKCLVGTSVKTIIGVDPSDVAFDNRVPDVTHIHTFFNLETARVIEREFGKVEIISASNCFAHIEDISDVTKGIKSLLAPEGTAIIEVHWLGSLIENNQFPFIYHEHMYYYSLKSLRYLLNQHGLEVFDVKHIPIHGGSIRFYCCHAGQHVPLESVAELRALEENMGLYRCETFENYGSKVRKAAEEFRVFIDSLNSQQSRVYAYGASGQATTLMSIYGITLEDISHIVDDSPLKIGRFMPNNHIPIVSSDILRSEPPDYILCLAYTFADEIMAKNSHFAGKWIIPLPELTVR